MEGINTMTTEEILWNLTDEDWRTEEELKDEEREAWLFEE